MKRNFYKGPFSLGRWGFAVNITALVYLAFVVIFWFFPYMKMWKGDNSMFSEYAARRGRRPSSAARDRAESETGLHPGLRRPWPFLVIQS